MTPSRRPTITVLAGTNGAGKSSVAGEMLSQEGGVFFDPDHATREFMGADATLGLAEANSRAWRKGKELLERAIARGLDYNFETTLGGSTIPRLLERAAQSGSAIRIWYVGLSSPELHIKRVRARVDKGGHDIGDEKIRDRYDRSRLNLVRLLPHLTELVVYDNSAERDPDLNDEPELFLILHIRDEQMKEMCKLSQVPHWAKPIVVAAMEEIDYEELPEI